MQDVTSKRASICNECGTIFPSMAALYAHRQVVHLKTKAYGVYRCMECDAITTRFPDHRKKCHPNGATFTILFQSRSHEEVRKRKKLLMSKPHLAKTTSRDFVVSKGRKSPSTVKPTKNSCPHCLKQFRSLALMHEHIHEVHNGRVFVCKKCGVKVKTLFAKSVHRKLHPGGTTFTIAFKDPQKWIISHIRKVF